MLEQVVFSGFVLGYVVGKRERDEKRAAWWRSYSSALSSLRESRGGVGGGKKKRGKQKKGRKKRFHEDVPSLIIWTFL